MHVYIFIYINGTGNIKESKDKQHVLLFESIHTGSLFLYVI